MSEETDQANIELAHRVVDFLNEAFALDPAAVSCLIFNHVPCNEAMAGHPTIQAGGRDGAVYVGMLGLLNGLCGIRPTGQGYINAIMEDDTGGNRELARFEVHV